MKTIGCILCLALISAVGSAETLRVPGQYQTIQAAIDAASPGDEVLVAPGVYTDCTHPVEGLAELHCVVMKSGVTLQSEAGPAVTTIDAGGTGRVMLANDCAEGTRIEGFTLTGGITANPSYGAGLRCKRSAITFVNVIITGNRTGGNGGGAYVDAGENRFQDCIFSQNRAATWYGGGLYCIGSNSVFERCGFLDNVGGSGGGIVCDFGGAPTFNRCVIAGNTARAGGGIWGSNSTRAVFTNCTVSDNTAASGASFLNVAQTNVSFIKCILAFGNGPALSCTSGNTFQCCDVYGHTGGDLLCGTDQGGNFSLDPGFVNQSAGDYTITNGSPCWPGNHLSGCNENVIGAWPEDETPIVPMTWGQIKATYR